jgi:valyl-tRNA synthetase
MSKSVGNVLDPLDFINGSPIDKLTERIKGSNMTKQAMKM